jgi:hypothetical protein
MSRAKALVGQLAPPAGFAIERPANFTIGMTLSARKDLAEARRVEMRRVCRTGRKSPMRRIR